MTRKIPVLLLFAALGVAAADKLVFRPGPASSYPNRQTNENVTIGVDTVKSAEQAKPAFGKVNPYEHGVLPVLVVVQNSGAKAIDLANLQVEYISAERSRVEPTPAEEVPYVYGNRGRKVSQSPLPSGIPRLSGKKNPLSAFEIQGRAFTARMLPAGESAHGFFYFQAGHRPGAKLYVTGLREAAGKDLFYFEIPLP